MARFAFKGSDELALRIAQAGRRTEEVCKAAVYAGAQVVADEVRRRLEALPQETYRYLDEGEKFDGVAPGQKEDLVRSFGVTPIGKDSNGVWNTKIGFDGYGSFPTKKYPRGLPNQLLARAIESGSSVRQKHPFVAPAVRASKKRALEAMERAADEEIEKMMEG